MPYTDKRRPSGGTRGWNESYMQKVRKLCREMDRCTSLPRKYASGKPSPAPAATSTTKAPESIPEPEAPSVRHLYQGRTGGQWSAMVTFQPWRGTQDELAAKKSVPVTAWSTDRLPGILHIWSRAERPAHWWENAEVHCPVCNAKLSLDGKARAGHSATFVCRYCDNVDFK